MNIIERLNQCAKDKSNQPLVCYGCAHSVASIIDGADFPGMPSGERPCCFCIRNTHRGLEVEKWYDQSDPVKVPMDCYHSLDMLEQIEKWGNKGDTKIYYFIIFMYGASEKLPYNDVIKEHPFDWQKDCNKRHPGQYVLKDWKIISKEEYENFKKE